VRHQIRCQCRQAIILAFRPAILDCDILAFEITGLSEPLAERGKGGLDSAGDLELKKPMTGIPCCSARAASGHATAAPPRSVMKSRRRIAFPKAQDQRHNTITAEIYALRNGVQQSDFALQKSQAAHVADGSWPCENASLDGPRPGERTSVVCDFDYVRIAAVSGWMPMMFMTRVRL
jgi:hypothetical protein